ncbi:MAG: hypothetical protein KAU95_03590 [Candidatus Aenigmarchaeota archaeon]|nr:hypothetical protein [Candidatus Aenigmarchaeota archaeon]
MKTTMVIPSYWGRESTVGWKNGDAVYDHATPLDKEGTLLRILQSLNILEDKNFQLVILAVATSEDIEEQVEKKVADIISSSDLGIDVLIFGNSHQRKIHDLFKKEGKENYINLLKLNGYSNIRNMCLFIPYILNSDIAVLIDDDEIFEDPKFMFKAKEFIGKTVNGKPVNAVAGYYLQPDGDYHVKKPIRPWMKYWNQYESMNDAFDKIIGTEPRLKETPFVFGGNMIIHRNLFTIIPFDPNVTRGEDIDFLINAKMFGHKFFLDNQLSIKHLPPNKAHPIWMQLREDIYRFAYERAKLENQKEIKGMTKVYAEEFDSYPGCFLKNDLNKKVDKSCRLLSEEYLAKDDKKGSEESLKNMVIVKTDAVPKFDPFQRLCELQKKWEELMGWVNKTEIRSALKDLLKFY